MSIKWEELVNSLSEDDLNALHTATRNAKKRFAETRAKGFKVVQKCEDLAKSGNRIALIKYIREINGGWNKVTLMEAVTAADLYLANRRANLSR